MGAGHVSSRHFSSRLFERATGELGLRLGSGEVFRLGLGLWLGQDESKKFRGVKCREVKIHEFIYFHMDILKWFYAVLHRVLY